MHVKTERPPLLRRPFLFSLTLRRRVHRRRFHSAFFELRNLAGLRFSAGGVARPYVLPHLIFILWRRSSPRQVGVHPIFKVVFVSHAPWVQIGLLFLLHAGICLLAADQAEQQGGRQQRVADPFAVFHRIPLFHRKRSTVRLPRNETIHAGQSASVV